MFEELNLTVKLRNDKPYRQNRNFRRISGTQPANFKGFSDIHGNDEVEKFAYYANERGAAKRLPFNATVINH